MTKWRHVVSAAAVLTAACGGSSRPTAPTVAPAPQPTPQTLTVLSGETGAPVAGARVNVGGQEQTTDAAGHVTVNAGLPGSTLVDVLAAGFFDRQTQLSRGAGPFTLWPKNGAAGLDEHFTGEVAYTDSSVGTTNPPFAAESMRGWPRTQSRVEVVLQGPGTNPGYRDFGPGALAVQREAVAAISDATGGRLVFQEPVAAEGGTSAGRIVVRIFPEYSTCVENNLAGVASVGGPTISGVVVTYCDVRWASNLSVSVHELGHAFGLRHSSDRQDVMFPGGARTAVPSPPERLLMTLMLQRPPGNRFPDNDRSASSATTKETLEFHCR